MEEYDVVIIGSGPAGLTAGIYSGRQGNKTLILDKGIAGGLGLEVPAMENYPGFELISGMELITETKKQAMKNAEIHEMESVKTVLKNNDFFIVKTGKSEYQTKSIIIATGTQHRKLGIKGEEEFLGRGVCYCATCDGPLFINKDVLMVGGGNSAIQEAIFLKNIGCNVTVIHRRDELRAEEYLVEKLFELDIPIIWNSAIEEIKGSQLIESVIIKNIKTENIEELNINGLFIAIGDNPNNKIAEDLGIRLNDSGFIITDKFQRTNIDFVYAIGDITDTYKQWIIACGEGATAAMTLYEDLQKNKV